MRLNASPHVDDAAGISILRKSLKEKMFGRIKANCEALSRLRHLILGGNPPAQSESSLDLYRPLILVFESSRESPPEMFL